MLLRSVAFLVFLTIHSKSIRAGRQHDQCQLVAVETDEIKGQCCVYYKNNVPNQGQPDLANLAFGGPNDGNRRRPADDRGKMFFEETYPRPDSPYVSPVFTKNERPIANRVKPMHDDRRDRNDTTTEVDGDVTGKVENVTVPDIGNRNNVNVPKTCTKGYVLDSDGNCVEQFN